MHKDARIKFNKLFNIYDGNEKRCRDVGIYTYHPSANSDDDWGVKWDGVCIEAVHKQKQFYRIGIRPGWRLLEINGDSLWQWKYSKESLEKVLQEGNSCTLKFNIDKLKVGDKVKMFNVKNRRYEGLSGYLVEDLVERHKWRMHVYATKSIKKLHYYNVVKLNRESVETQDKFSNLLNQDMPGPPIAGPPMPGQIPVAIRMADRYGRRYGSRADTTEMENTPTIRLLDIPTDTQFHDLLDLVRDFHSLKIRLPRDQDYPDGRSRNRGFAFITFSSHEDAERAKYVLDGHAYGTNILHAEWSRKYANFMKASPEREDILNDEQDPDYFVLSDDGWICSLPLSSANAKLFDDWFLRFLDEDLDWDEFEMLGKLISSFFK